MVKDITGQRFYKIVVLRYAGLSGKYHAWVCRCDCTKEFTSLDTNIKSGKVKSCGCVLGIEVSVPITQEQLKKLYTYDPLTGFFIRNINMGAFKAGDIVGSKNPVNGYMSLGIKSKRYKSHRLAWLYMTGEFPAQPLDHKNTIRDDNRWENLRLATTSLNLANLGQRPGNTSGFKGVCLEKRALKRKKHWRCTINHQGRHIHIGMFETAEEAALAYDTKAIELSGAFARINFPRDGYNTVGCLG